MERNYYYIGIAFFGMINGLYNQIALLFALIHVQILRTVAPVRQHGPDADVLVADGLDGDDHHRGHTRQRSTKNTPG